MLILISTTYRRFNFAAEMAQLVKRQVLLDKLNCKTCLSLCRFSILETAELNNFRKLMFSHLFNFKERIKYR